MRDRLSSTASSFAPERTRGLVSGRVALGTPIVVACLAVIAVADLLIWRAHPSYAVNGLLDEPAHLATGLLALAALAAAVDLSLLLAVIAGSLLIDLDHLPHVFGSSILQVGTPRPYTHSLGTLVVLLVIAALLRGRRRYLLLVATAILALHFFRDMAEPGGPGVSLLWPLSDSGVTVGYGWYAAVMAACAAAALIMRRSETVRPSRAA